MVTRTPRGRGLGPAFTNIFIANLSSSLGDGIAKTAIPLLAVRLTSDPLLIAGVSALAMLPWLLFAIPAGILIDRIDRRVALAASNSVRVALAFALLGLTASGTLTIWWLYLVIFVYGACETVYDGAIRAVVPSIVPREGLPKANSRIEAGELVVQNFLSAPITSALFAVTALIPLGLNGAVFAIAVGLAFFLPKAASGKQFADHPDDAPVVWFRQLADGFRFVIANRMLRTLWFLSSFVGLAFAISTGGFVLYLLDRLELPEALFGIFLLTGALGGILGSVVTSWLKNRYGAGPVMAVSSLVAGLTLAFVGLVPTLWAAGVGYFVMSGAVLVWNILVVSLRQSIIPGRLLGRVHGTWRTLLWGCTPIGAVIGGLLGRIDLTLPWIVGGAAASIATLMWFRFLRSLPNPEDVHNGDDPEVSAVAH